MIKRNIDKRLSPLLTELKEKGLLQLYTKPSGKYGYKAYLTCPSCNRQRWANYHPKRSNGIYCLCKSCARKKVLESPDIIESIRKSMIEINKNPDVILNKKISLVRRWSKPGAKESFRLALSNNPLSSIHKRIAMLKHFEDPKAREKVSIYNKKRYKEHPRSQETKDKIRETNKKLWLNLEYKEKRLKITFKSRMVRPTKPEALLNELLQSNYHNQWIYNGDCSHNVIIGGLIPDFVNVNGKKQVMELFGDYYHNPKLRNVSYSGTEEGRIKTLKEFGFDCLIIWEHELVDIPQVISKIGAFNKGGNDAIMGKKAIS